MVQRHERRCVTLRFCRLWFEGFAPHTASSRLPIPRCVSLHHGRRDQGQLCRVTGRLALAYIMMNHHAWRVVKSKLLQCTLLKKRPAFHGAKARTAALHFEILEVVVRRLRTTHRKLSPSDSTVCAFAPLEKRPRSVGPWRGVLRDHI